MNLSTPPGEQHARCPAEALAARLGSILSSTAIEVYFIDTETLGFVDVNVAASQHLGYGIEELRAMSVPDIAVRFDRQAVEDRVRPLIAGTTDEIVWQTIHRRRDGSTYPVEIAMLLSRAEEGEVFVALAQNISSRLVAETALRESRERLEMVLRGADLGSWDADFATRTTVFDQRSQEIVGREFSGPLDDAVWATYIHPDDIERVRQAWRPQLRQETAPYQSEFRILAADGGWRWLRARGKVVERDANGRALRAAGTYLDVTAEKKAEEAFAESDAELRALFEGSADLILLLDGDGLIVRANRAAIRTVSPRGPYVAGRSFFDYLRSSDEPRFRGFFEAALGGERTTVEIGGESGQGEEHFELRFSPIGPARSGRSAVAVFARDVTERKQTERAFFQAQKMESLGILAGGVAHDFNNLLAAILGNAQLALEGLPGGSVEREAVADIELAARRAAELVQQLLSFAGKASPVVDNVDLNQLIGEMIDLLSVSIPAQVEIRRQFSSDRVVVRGDATQLRQVVMNLFINAADATAAKGGRVTVSTAALQPGAAELADNIGGPLAPGAYVAITVRDTGSGMSAETMAKIFDPFFTTKADGRGLGLAAALGIVRGHGGGIQLQSELGVGTSFTILLPAARGDR